MFYFWQGYSWIVAMYELRLVLRYTSQSRLIRQNYHFYLKLLYNALLFYRRFLRPSPSIYMTISINGHIAVAKGVRRNWTIPTWVPAKVNIFLNTLCNAFTCVFLTNSYAGMIPLGKKILPKGDSAANNRLEFYEIVTQLHPVHHGRVRCNLRHPHRHWQASAPMEFQIRVRSRVQNCPNEFSSGRVRAHMIGPRGPPESCRTSSSNREAEAREKKKEREKRRREDPPNKTAKKLWIQHGQPSHRFAVTADTQQKEGGSLALSLSLSLISSPIRFFPSLTLSLPSCERIFLQ